MAHTEKGAGSKVYWNDCLCNKTFDGGGAPSFPGSALPVTRAYTRHILLFDLATPSQLASAQSLNPNPNPDTTMPSLPLSSPLPRLRPLLRSGLRARAYSIASKPHAYLTPFLSHPSLEFAGNTEGLQGVSCLVMDRPEVKNALSTRMVMVRRRGHGGPTVILTRADADPV